MMMERARTAPAPESVHQEKPTEPAPSAASTSTAPVNASAEERVQDLERRLNLLDTGDGGGDAAAAPSTAPTATAAAPAPPAAPAAAPAAKPNPLLKRIQAAQERARLAEQKEKESKAAAAAELERQKREAEEAAQRAAEQERIAKAQSALRSVAGKALEDKQKDILMQLEGKAPPPPVAAAPPAAAADTLPPPPAFSTLAPTLAPPSQAAATPGVPIMKTMDPPPPSFDSMKFPPPKMQQQLPGSEEMIGHGMNSRVLSQPSPPPPQMQQAPPSFDFVEEQLHKDVPPPPPAPTAPSAPPSAPPIAMPEEREHHLHGIMPVAPPPQQQQQQDAMAPPSFADFEQQQPPPDTAAVDDDGVFDYDLDGNPLTPEQRQALLDEQRQLYENIMKEKAANDTAIARAQADAFDSRSSNAAAAAMSPGTSHAARNRAMDSVGRDAAAGAAAREGEAAAASSEGEEQGPSGERRMVKIGSNQLVALHGQDRTKKAIKEGTAILVQCINCQNWMQVTDTATLMFCPVCQVVSPVIPQKEVMTKEEAIQLTMDRKLAEKLQAEAYAERDAENEEEEDEGWLSSFFGGNETSSARPTAASSPSPSAAAASAGAAGAQSDSWWDKISSIVSYGVADEGRERGDLGVTRPPGSPQRAQSQYPAQRSRAGNAPASRSPAHNEERRGLLVNVDGSGNENTANLPSGRVAESKPLFSCMMDSVSNAANAVWSTGGEQDGEGNVHGVDSSSLLITNAGRGVGDGSGDYSQLPDRERF
eukprot:CAMPEP_0183723136 /NCGR_PEP_ID=MMETSP0737-20130205/14832_1 /TAXON_ID=385413 /ORGANISM="Thalassiosira miniscula, Strain CCMP1093" /LENGTH=761 /DNA_ID=CAMNT_0025953389 /DNA_START=205 /DNA_END=2490 /DNA_ORIENTATION=+